MSTTEPRSGQRKRPRTARTKDPRGVSPHRGRRDPTRPNVRHRTLDRSADGHHLGRADVDRRRRRVQQRGRHLRLRLALRRVAPDDRAVARAAPGGSGPAPATTIVDQLRRAARRSAPPAPAAPPGSSASSGPGAATRTSGRPRRAPADRPERPRRRASISANRSPRGTAATGGPLDHVDHQRGRPVAAHRRPTRTGGSAADPVARPRRCRPGPAACPSAPRPPRAPASGGDQVGAGHPTSRTPSTGGAEHRSRPTSADQRPRPAADRPRQRRRAAGAAGPAP